MSSEYTVFRGMNAEVEIYENSDRFTLMIVWPPQGQMITDLTAGQLEDLAFNILQVVAYCRSSDSDSAKALELVGRMDGGPRLEK